jgi:hypothetical protein
MADEGLCVMFVQMTFSKFKINMSLLRNSSSRGSYTIITVATTGNSSIFTIGSIMLQAAGCDFIFIIARRTYETRIGIIAAMRSSDEEQR